MAIPISVLSAIREASAHQITVKGGKFLEKTAKAIAARVGVDEYHVEVLPEDKARFMELEKAAGRGVIMVGDGINDSPALSAADVGIAISDGAQLAREIADITIDADSLSGLILLGISGMIQPAFSALVHNLSTLAISLNSMKNLLEDGEPEGIPFFLIVINSHQKNIARISLNP